MATSLFSGLFGTKLPGEDVFINLKILDSETNIY